MKTWIARLFKSAGEPAPARQDAPAAVPAAPGAQANYAELEQRYWRWLCGLPASGPPLEPAGPAARLVLDELARLARAPEQAAELVPRVPEVIPRLLRSLRNEGVSGAELAREVTRDAVLAAEVIREANSPFYRQSKPVRTVDAAILVLGQNGLRMLLARVAFRPIIGAATGRLARLAAPRLWLHSERCARAASLLAPPLGADPFEGYLAGLMLNVGLLVAFRLVDQLDDSGSVPQGAAVPALLAGARELSARIALYWELPPPIGAAILSARDANAKALPRALGQADDLARLRLLFDHGALLGDDALLASLDGPVSRVFERLAPEPG
jgi:HD-like signal output (HDOD) protein